jgi:antitoxin VapB
MIFSALKSADVPFDFLTEKERNQGLLDRDPFEGWCE